VSSKPIPLCVDHICKPPEFVMGQRQWVITLHLGQTDTRGWIALNCPVPHGIVEYPPQNAKRVAGGRNELRSR